jgi:NitT/TauT family transport system ATP-binding protein
VAEPAKAKILLERVEKRYPTRRSEVEALGGLDFHVWDGEFFCILGPSGCGKSTLLRILAGLETASAGGIRITSGAGGRPLTSMVFQEESTLPWMSVRDNVAFGLEMRGLSRRARHERVGPIIQKVGLSHFADYYPHQLSGGMRQRVSIARALANDPEVLLMDEPFASLDAQNRLILQAELLRIWEEARKTVVYITHSLDEAISLGDRILVMTARPGRIKRLLAVDLPRPRDVVSVRAHPRYAALHQELWDVLEDEVRQSRQAQGEL